MQWLFFRVKTSLTGGNFLKNVVICGKGADIFYVCVDECRKMPGWNVSD